MEPSADSCGSSFMPPIQGAFSDQKMPEPISITPYQLATRFIGMTEVDGAVHNPQIMAMLQLDNRWPETDEVPWCSAFVNYIAFLLNLERTKSLMARSWLLVGESVELDRAKQGFDLVIFSRPPNPDSGHVGFYSGRDQQGVWCLGGNQSNSVSAASYPADRVLGVRRLRSIPE